MIPCQFLKQTDKEEGKGPRDAQAQGPHYAFFVYETLGVGNRVDPHSRLGRNLRNHRWRPAARGRKQATLGDTQQGFRVRVKGTLKLASKNKSRRGDCA